MQIKKALLILSLSCFSLFGSVEKSILPSMDQLVIKELDGKINASQTQEIDAVITSLDARLRVMSFNMLLNWSEDHLEPVDKWETRKSRVVEYIQWAHPDIIGSQELQADQLDDLMDAIGDDYGYYGTGIDDGVRGGDIPAIFYRKERIEKIQGQTFYFSETPQVISKSPFGQRNTFLLCQFRDKKTGADFLILNTHLAFSNFERRFYEASKLRDFLLEKAGGLPILMTGDFNTFPFRQELDLPFYDGDRVVQTIEKGGVVDSLKHALFGHFGPISSTNFSSELKKPFCSEGEPDIILDHIFVSKEVKILAHGIDPARVDGRFPSDHFPVIADVIFVEKQD